MELEFPPIYDGNLNLSTKSSDDFERIYGIPCWDKYALNPDSEEYYLLENGSIYGKVLDDRPSTMLNINDFCLAIAMVPYENDTRVLMSIVATCFPTFLYEDEPQDKIPPWYSIGLILSTPFLLLTFLTYCIIPDINEIYRKCVQAYVAMLFFAYIALGIVQIGGDEIVDIPHLCITLGNFRRL